jgi:tRNA A37 threonylcarbamoyladenosine biosynthesis protein TsaE
MPKSVQPGFGTGPWPGTGHSSTGSSPNTGTGGTKSQFFNGLRKHMEKKGWKTLSVPGFEWAAMETAHFDLDSLFAAFDADATDNLEGAHLKLSHWADSQKEKVPQTRIALAVFDSGTQDQIEFITKKLQEGTRMGAQSMTAVVDLKTGRLFEPQEGSGSGHERIRFNKPVFDELKAVVEVLAAAATNEK